MKAFLVCLLVMLSFCNGSAHAQAYDDSLAVDHRLKPISQGEYMNAVLRLASRAKLDSIDFLTELGLSVNRNCDEICDTYLSEKHSKKQLPLPSNFDQGIIDLIPSPESTRFLTYSSYDGPDYTNYSIYRAEILTYRISGEAGLEAIHEGSELHLYDWSIEDLVWVDDKTVVLKAYSGTKSATGVNGGYSYFKLPL